MLSSLRNATAAWLFLLCLAGFTACSLWLATQTKWSREGLTAESLLQGHSALAFEKTYNDGLPFKEATTNFWGALRYHLFHTGAKGVVIGEDGWLYTAEEFEEPKYFQRNIRANLALIQEVRATLAAHHIPLLLVVIPAKTRIYPEHLGGHMVPPQRAALYDAVLASLPPEVVLDGAQVFLEMKKATTSLPFMQTDTHWSPEGAKAMARAIARRQPEGLSDAVAFASHNTKTKPYSGDLARFVPGAGLSEPVTVWQNEGGAEDLFGEAQIPVALVGTSYSAQEQWNFPAFLQEALQRDVLNMADAGEGPIAPMRKFLKETNLENSGIRWVVWEFPERFFAVSPALKKEKVK